MGSTAMLMTSVFVTNVSYNQQARLAKGEEAKRTKTSQEKNRKEFEDKYNRDNNQFQEIIENYENSDTTTGQGLYYQAIAMLNEGYMKDLMGMYKESEEGKFDDYTYRNKAPSFLAIHVNETGFYSGSSALPKGPFPMSGGKVTYNQAYNGLPKEAMTWKGYNKNVYGKIGQGQIKDTGTGGQDIFVFQMRNTRFGSGSSGQGSKSTAGYNENVSSTRNADGRHLPDQIAVSNREMDAMIKGSEPLKKIYSEDPLAVAALRAIEHNRGSVSQQAFGIPYHPNGQTGGGRPKRANVNSEEALIATLDLYKDSQEAAKKFGYKPTGTEMSDSGFGRAAATILLTKGGKWKVSVYSQNYWSNKHPAKFVAAWNSIFPSDKISKGDVSGKLAPYVSTTTKELGISSSQSKKIYGTTGDYNEINDLGDSWKSGMLFKVTQETSSKYVNGPARRVLAFDTVSAGHALQSSCGPQIWESLMLMAMEESGIDPTNPKFHAQTEKKTQEENKHKPNPDAQKQPAKKGYVTKDAELAKILSLMGLSTKMDRTSYDVLRGGLEASGGWYSQGNRNKKDKEGNYWRDCSSLVGYALEQAPKPKAAKASRWHTTATLYGNYKPLTDLKVTKSNWKSIAKPGDIFVRRSNGSGHTFIFVGVNNTGKTVTIPASLTYRQKDVKIKNGEFLAIESHKTGTRNGLFSRSGNLGPYKIKRPIR